MKNNISFIDNTRRMAQNKGEAELRETGKDVCWMIKRQMCFLMIVCLLFAGMAFAEGGQQAGEIFGSADLDGDGVEETLRLYRKNGEGMFGDEGVEVVLAAYRADGGLAAEGTIYNYYDVNWANPTVEVSVYDLGGGRLYVEGQWTSEGTETVYQVFDLKDGRLEKRVYVRDPGYSDGIGLEDMFTNEVVFYSKSMDCELLVQPLEEIFAEYEMRYAVRNFSAVADLSKEQLLCRANVEEIPFGGPVSSVTSSGPADARTTGDVNLRSGPGLGYDSLGVISAGNTVEYLGESSVDERGVAWYRIRYNEKEGWGSSKYVVIDEQ